MAKESGKRNTQETSLAKWISCNAAFEAANNAVQIHGAYGYSDEYPVERFLRNSKAPVIYEGTRKIHTIMQGEYALGYREDKPLRKQLPAWPFEPASVTKLQQGINELRRSRSLTGLFFGFSNV